jgi:four helix bundle protein
VTEQDLLPRTKRFALENIALCGGLPNRPEGWVLGKQLLRSGTSIGANYREAQRSRSRPEFSSKIHICQQEIEETVYWLELVLESGLASGQRISLLCREVQELRAIFIAIGRSHSPSGDDATNSRS